MPSWSTAERGLTKTTRSFQQQRRGPGAVLWLWRWSRFHPPVMHPAQVAGCYEHPPVKRQRIPLGLRPLTLDRVGLVQRDGVLTEQHGGVKQRLAVAAGHAASSN